MKSKNIKNKRLSKKVRFEVFKRDSFTCQYCGLKAPDVILNVDHILPISKGGSNEILNLITSCKDCNSGKSNKELSDKSAIQIQRQQIEEHQERKDQLTMIYNWKRELLNTDKDIVSKLEDFWIEMAGGRLSVHGRSILAMLYRKYGIECVMDAVKTAQQYIKVDTESNVIHESREIAFNKIGAICFSRHLDKSDPNLSKAYYLRGILRNRIRYVDNRVSLKLIQQLLACGIDYDLLKDIILKAKHWSGWKSDMINMGGELD